MARTNYSRVFTLFAAMSASLLLPVVGLALLARAQSASPLVTIESGGAIITVDTTADNPDTNTAG